MDIKFFILNNLFLIYFKSFLFFKLFFKFYFINFLSFKSFYYIPIYYENKIFYLINKSYNFIIYDFYFLNCNFIYNLLFFYNKRLINLLRFGILNRLDKNTSGLLILFKKISFYISYIIQFNKNFLKKNYIVFIYGKKLFNNYKSFTLSSFFNLKYKKNYFNFFLKIFSLSNFFFIKSFKFFNYFVSILKCALFSGRTHQIRIYFNYIKNYILGDSIYNNFNKKTFFKYFNRHFIHLYYLKFYFLNFNFSFVTSLYCDMLFFLNDLKSFS